MYHNTFLDSKRYNRIHIENTQEVRNMSLAPFIVEGGSIFKKPSYFLESVIVGQAKESKEGMISYRNGNFAGYDGENWKTFTKESLWMSGEDDNIVYTMGRRIGINKLNPKKALEVGGDVLIDKKLVVCEDANLGVGVCLGHNAGKKKAGYIRFWENFFEGYDGEKWVPFGKSEQIIENKVEPEPIDLTAVEKIKLLCPMIFTNTKVDSHFYYNFEKNEFRMEKMNDKLDTIKMEDLSLGNIKIGGDIIFSDGKVRHSIRNVGDPVYAGDVATKRYVDQICNGLQNYIVSDFLCMGADGSINEVLELSILRTIGELSVDKYVVMLNRSGPELFKILEIENSIKLEKINDISLPAKLYIREGRYGRSEYFLFNKGSVGGYDSLQINGIENLEYVGGISKVGKEIRLKLDGGIFMESTQGITLLENSIDASKYIKDGTLQVDWAKIPDGMIDTRHIGPKVIQGLNIHPKTVGDGHLKDGSIRNHHLTVGIITEKELASDCVDRAHLKEAIIHHKNLTAGCVMGANIDEEQIEARHLCAGAVDTKHLCANIILGEHIANEQIGANHLRNEIIHNIHLSEACVGWENICGDSIKRGHIAQNAVGSLNIEDDAITAQHIRPQSITGDHILRNSVVGHHIGLSQIRRDHLEDSFLEERHLSANIIREDHIIDNVITGAKIKNNAIEGKHITLNSIDDKHIMNMSIKGSKLLDGSISENKIVDESISTNKLKDKSITNDKIRLPFIKISSDPVFTCTQVVNLGETFNLGLNQNYMIPKIREGVAEFLTNVRFGEEGSNSHMEINIPVEFKGGEKLHYIGEIIGMYNGIRLEESFLKKWVKCDGSSVRKCDYYDLYIRMGADDSGEDNFYLPKITNDVINYFVRFQM